MNYPYLDFHTLIQQRQINYMFAVRRAGDD